MIHFKFILYVVMLMVLSGCSNKMLENYDGTQPQFDIESYFNGTVKAWGVIQNHRGLVIKRFDLTMECDWSEGQGVFNETFTYYDGTTEKRTWRVNKLDDHSYQATAGDIIGTAVGMSKDTAMRWRYAMDIPVGRTDVRIRFDDWMFQMNDGVVINRSYLKKFGITVAELTVFMQKQPLSNES